MKEAVPSRAHLLSLLTALIVAAGANAATQLVLDRDTRPQGEFKGVVELSVAPPADNVKISVTVDGDKLADLRSPYRVTVDFGPRVVEHKIVVTALTTDRRRVQWQTTINKGHQPLSVKLRAVDAAKGEFEATTTAPDDDPIAKVELWENGSVIATATEAPYRLTAPAATTAGFVQVTARTKSGEEAADFWSAAGEVKVDNVDVRTVPLYVSIVDRNGSTLATDVDRTLFRILDNDSEGKIIEFGKAFDQPISIALLIDASASMTYAMHDAINAALGFTKHTLKDGDRCAIFSIRDVPRREQALTADREQVEKALTGVKPQGQTALYDAIVTAIRELRDEKNRRAIVVLTDGGDTSSNFSYDDAEKAAREAGIPIYFIAYESWEPATAQDIERLRFIATETGGFVATASQQNLVAKYSEIEKDLRAQFAITYQVTDFAKHNEWRKVRVLLNSTKLSARTIGGYFAP